MNLFCILSWRSLLNFANISTRLTGFSIWSLALFSFVSLSATALSHIFIVIPCFYFLFLKLKDREWNFSKSSWALLGMFVFGVISVLFAPDISAKFKAISKLKYLLFGLLAIFPYQAYFKDVSKKQIRHMVTAFLVLLAIGNVAGIHALFDGFHYLRMKEASDGTRAAGMYGMAITYGYGIELVFIILLGLTVNFWRSVQGFVNRNILVISLITTAFGFYFAYARGAMLAFIISLPFVFMKSRPKIFYTLMILGTFLIGIATSVVFSKSGDSGNRFLLSAKTESNMIRLSQYEAAVAAFKEKPWTGWGYRNFEANAYDIKERNNIAYKEFYGHAHNNYLEFLASTGIFGFISIVLFVVFWLFEMWKRNDAIGTVLLPFVISFAVSGLFQNTINDGENMFVIMFLYALSQYPHKVILDRK